MVTFPTEYISCRDKADISQVAGKASIFSNFEPFRHVNLVFGISLYYVLYVLQTILIT